MHDKISEYVILCFAFVGTFMTAIAAIIVPESVAMNQVAAEVQRSLESAPTLTESTLPPVRINIIDDNKLRIWCLIGAMGASIVGVCLFKWTGPRDLALKLVGSSLIGFIFTPGVMRYLEITPEVDLVLLWSAGVALFGAGILKGVFPAVIWTGKSLLARTFKLEFPPDNEK
jgi:hypothetical protein